MAGACCCGAPLEDDVGPCGVSPAPLPGVMGPSTPENGVGACGVGASGTAGCCCWARAAVHQVELRTAASAIAVKPGFTGISSSRTPRRARRADRADAPCQLKRLWAGKRGFIRQTIRRATAAQVAPTHPKQVAYALFGVPIPSI